MDSEVMVLEEAAKFLKVHPSTVYRLLKNKGIPAFKVGSDWRFSAAALTKWISEKIAADTALSA